MTREEIKLQCLRMAIEILEVGRSSLSSYSVGDSNVPGVKTTSKTEEVLEKAKQIFDWVIDWEVVRPPKHP